MREIWLDHDVWEEDLPGDLFQGKGHCRNTGQELGQNEWGGEYAGIEIEAPYLTKECRLESFLGEPTKLSIITYEGRHGPKVWGPQQVLLSF